MEHKAQLKDLMQELSHVYGYKIDKDLLRIYWEALRGYSDARVAQAMRRVILTCKYFPRPAHLIEILKQNEPSTQTPDELISGNKCTKCGKTSSMLRDGQCRNCYTGLSDDGIQKRLAKITKVAINKL